MYGIKTILVPIDFSDCAENALKYALILAGRMDAKVILYHSYFSPHTAHLSARSATEGKKSAREISEEQLQDAYMRAPHLPLQEVEYHTSPREMREELPQLVLDKKVDLIVMGTQGIGWLGGRIFGTNTSWTIENIGCPIIAIPETEVALQIKNVMYASDYLDSDVGNLELTALIAKLFEAELKIVHVRESDEQEQESSTFIARVKAAIPSFDFQFVQVNAPNVEQGLEDYLDHHPVDLLVMSAQRRNGLERLFGKSITKLMVHHLSGPALFFHHEKKE